MILTLAMIAAGIGGLVTLGLAVAYALDSDMGMRVSNHSTEHLPSVMVGRYVGFTVLALFSALYGDAVVICVLFAVFAGISFYDAFVYSSEDLPWIAHAAAGALCFIVIGLSGVAVVLGM